MPRVLTNDFSWSKSRHEKLTECLRAYYLHYYRSWGGWGREAPADVRELYTLKKLGNRFTWAGSVVHDAIKDVLLDIRAGRPVEPARVEERARNVMREDFRHSKSRAYRTGKGPRKSFAGLVEHEYAEPVTDQAWKDSWETARAALAGFFASRWPTVARGLKPEQWLEVDAGFEFSHFTLDGVKVFAIPDFAYVDDAGAPVVVDWKTGRAREGYDEQVLGYALYVAQRYRFPVERVRTALVYLNELKDAAPLETDVPVDEAAISGFRAHFSRSVERMRALLAEPASNVAKDESAFPMTEDLGVCAKCVFRRACGRESVAIAAA